MLEDAAKAHVLRWATVTLAPVVLVVSATIGIVIGVGGVVTPAHTAGSCAPGSPVPSNANLDPSTVDGINALKADYEAVATGTDLPWSALAAVDYRESNNDPDRSALAGEPLGQPNPDHPEITVQTKRESIERSADYLRSLGSGVYGVNLTAGSGQDDLALAFLAYNRGYIYAEGGGTPDQSPYVYNQWDEAHADMTWPDLSGEPLAGQQEVGRYGALTVWARLGGSSGSNCRGGVSGEASDLLANTNVTLSASHRDDLEAGLIDPRIIGALLWIARDHTIVVSSLRSDHSVCAGGSGNETADGCASGRSNHADGRGVDIGVVDGSAVAWCESCPARSVVDAILAEPSNLGLTELGQPYYDRTDAATYVFTSDHGDHLHLGIDG